MFNMLKRRKAMTVCADEKHYLDVDEIVSTINMGLTHVYYANEKVYLGFETKLTMGEVAKLIKQKLYKTEAEVVGGVIFVKFK